MSANRRGPLECGLGLWSHLTSEKSLWVVHPSTQSKGGVIAPDASASLPNHLPARECGRASLGRAVGCGRQCLADSRGQRRRTREIKHIFERVGMQVAVCQVEPLVGIVQAQEPFLDERK